MTTFLIIGGTGKVGSRLARLLRDAGHGVRIASRTAGDVRFDWRDAESYGPAFAGVDGVFLVGPGSATDWSDTLSAVLAVAATEGVRHAVFLSARGVEFLPDGAVDRAERALMAGPVPWTILRPSHFAQNFTEAMFVPEDGVVVAPVAAGAEPFIDAFDIAAVAAEVLGSGGWTGGSSTSPALRRSPSTRPSPCSAMRPGGRTSSTRNWARIASDFSPPARPRATWPGASRCSGGSGAVTTRT